MWFNQKIVVTYFLFFCFSVLYADTSETGLSNDTIEEIMGSFSLNPMERAIMNAVTNNPVSELALNRGFIVNHNDYFSNTIETKGITDQKRSGRCWLFAGLNVLRPEVIQKYKLSDFEFSQNYLFFWDKMEKANFFLESIIETADRDILDREIVLLLKRPIGDGGLWTYVVDLIVKYGVVPKDAMPETYSSRNSWTMNSFIARKLRENATEIRAMIDNGVAGSELRKRKVEMLKVIYRMLVLNLGEPPTKFTWRYENKEGEVSKLRRYTPQEFYKEVVGFDISQYIALMNYPAKEYNRLYEFHNARNICDASDPTYANLDIAQIKEFTVKSVLDDEPVWFACDIIKDKDSEHGILSTEVIDYQSLYGLDYTINKADRILYRESYGNHAMVFTGVDLQNKEPVKWLVEDSHGAERGHNGHWTLYDDWFNEFVYTVIINKKYLPLEIKNIFKQKPVILPPWEPMVLLLKNTQ
jgi:bleomycin hydrolase